MARIAGLAATLAMAALLAFLVPNDQPTLPTIPWQDLPQDLHPVLQKDLDQILAHPESDAAWGDLGWKLKTLRLKQQAIDCLIQAEKLNPQEPRWPYAQALIWHGTSNQLSLANFRRAAFLCGNHPPIVRLRLARLLMEHGAWDEARQALAALMEAHPNLGPAHLLLAQIHQAQGQWTQARQTVSICLTNPYTAQAAWSLWSALEQRSDQPESAARARRRQQALAPDIPWPDPFEAEAMAWRQDAQSLSQQAQAYLMANRPDLAHPWITNLQARHPNYPRAWLLDGRMQNLLHRPEAAETSLRKYLQIEPDSANGLFQLGKSLLMQNRFQEAARVFQSATRARANFGPAYFNLGFALAKAGRPEEAIPAFEESMRHNPEIFDTYLLLADLHWQLGHSDAARSLADQAAKVNPDDPRLPVLRDKLARGTGQPSP